MTILSMMSEGEGVGVGENEGYYFYVSPSSTPIQQTPKAACKEKFLIKCFINAK